MSTTTNKPLYKVSIRALADFCQSKHDLISMFRPSASALEGQHVHKIIQDNRPANYTAEVYYSFLWSNPDFDIKISGRADGVLSDGVEELKSTRLPPEDIPVTPKSLHKAQAKLYGAMFAWSENKTEQVCVKITYVHSQTLQEWTIDHTYSREYLIQYLIDCCIQYEHWLKLFYDHQNKKSSYIKKLKFPYPSMRKSQRLMAESIYKACKTHRDICIEAPTGTGKTLASIFPALKALPPEKPKSLFFLTMKTTGQQAAKDALNQLDPNHHLTVVSLTARNRMCLSIENVCDGAFCPFAKDYFAKRSQLRDLLFQKHHWTIDEMLSLGSQHEICPYYLSQDWAIWSDVVICDLNYIYDTTAVQPYLLKEIDNQATLLIDESHNLIERGRMIFSTEFSGAQLQSLMAKCPTGIKKILTKIQSQLRYCCNVDEIILSNSPPTPLIKSLKDFLSESATLLRENSSFEPPALWQEFILTSSRFTRLHELASVEDFCWRITPGKPNQRKLELICLNPARLLKQKHDLVDNVIAFSATLKPWNYSTQLNGLATAITQELASPFVNNQFQVYIANDVSTRFKDKHNLPTKLRPVLEMIIENTRNTIVFFSSYQQLLECAKRIQPHTNLLIQSQDWSSSIRDTILNRFRTEHGLTLFSVLGGAFSEGIDLPGVQLEQVVIIGPGLPQMNDVNNARRLQLDQNNQPGFEFTYIFPGLQKVLQAAGRCIRTETDVGEILLIDDRFEGYFQNGWLPAQWTITIGALKYWAPTDADLTQPGNQN